MVKTYIGAAGNTTTTANETEYFFLGGNISKNTTESSRQILFRSAGTLSGLYIRVTANAVTASSTVRTRLNAGNGGQSVSIGSTATGEFTDSSGTDTIAAGDKLNYQYVNGDASNTMTFSVMSCVFIATTDTVTRVILTHDIQVTTASTTWFSALCGAVGAAVTTETNAKQRMRKAGTLKNACVNVSSARATATTIKSRKNGADGNLSISCTGGVTGIFEDTTHSDTVSAGEDWNWSLTTGTGVDGFTTRYIAADFVSTAQIGIVGNAHMTTVAYADNTVRWTQISGIHTSVATEANTKADCRIAGTYSELTCLVTQNGVSSASSLTLRKNGADTALIASITGSTTGVFSDSSHTVTLVSTDEINYQITIPSVAGSQTVSICNYSMFITAINEVIKSLTETVSISESLARLAAKTRTLTESPSASSSVTRLAAKNRSPSTETVSVSSSVTRTDGKIRTLSDTVTVGESLNRQTQKTRTLSDTVIIGESLSRLAAKIRALLDTIAISSSVTAEKGTSGNNVVRTLTEDTAISDSVTRLAEKTRAITETTSISDSLTRQDSKTRELTDTVAVSSSVVRQDSKTRTLSDTVSTSDSVARQAAKNRALTENVSISSSVTRLAEKIRTLATQVVSISDDVQRTVTSGGNNVIRTLTENVSISSSVARLANKIRSITETVPISESLTFVNSNVPVVIERIFHGAGSGGRRLKRLLRRSFILKHRNFKL